MDIAIISEHASPIGVIGGTDSGGQNVYVAQLAKHFTKLGHKVEVFTRRETPDIPMVQDLKDGYKLINIPAGPAHKIPKEEILPYMEEFTVQMLQYFEKRKKSFDVIHANFFMSGLVAADLKKLTGIPFLITFHALGKIRKLHQGDDDAFPPERSAIEERLVLESDRIIAECPQDLEDLMIHYQADTDKIDIVPCGFDSQEIYPINKTEARLRLGIDSLESVVLHVGRMVPRKGVDNVIRGFSSFFKESHARSRLIIVGGNSNSPDPKLTPELGRLMKIAEEEGVGQFIDFTGNRDRDELKLFYSAADVFVTTPWYEPFGITPVEAMACGTPVIGSNVGGIKFTVGHDETGLLVPPRDPAALKDALLRILNDSSLRKEFSRQAIQKAHQLFRWDMMAGQIAKIIESKIMKKFEQELPDSALMYRAAEMAMRQNLFS